MRKSKSSTIKIRSVSHKNQDRSIQKKIATPLLEGSNISVPQQIKAYIDKRLQVQVVVYFQQYKQQFFLKAKRLHDYLYRFPSMKEKYLGEDNIHFQIGLQFLMIELFKKGIIVSQSYDNLRQDAVNQLQNWVLSWIQRKLIIQKTKQDEQQQIIKLCDSMAQIQQYAKTSQVEELPF